MSSPKSNHVPNISTGLFVSSVDQAAWDRAEDPVGIRDSVAAPGGSGIQGSAVGRQVRALICLLQLAGLSGGRGWRPLLYAGLLLLLSSAVCGYLAVLAFWNGRALLTAGVHFIRVFVITQYFGFSIIIPWLALTAKLLKTRARYSGQQSSKFTR